MADMAPLTAIPTVMATIESGSPPLVSPTSSLKRRLNDTSLIDGEPFTSGQLSTASKRPRVTFDLEPHVRVFDGQYEKGLDLVRAEVNRAIADLITGDGGACEQIQQLFETSPGTKDAPSPTLLKRYLIALMGRISQINKQFAGLVHAILNSRWLAYDDSYQMVYEKFLAALLSAQSGFLSSTLRMLVKNFMHLGSAGDRGSGPRPSSKSQLFTRVHQVIENIIRLVPAASSVLSAIVGSSYPYDSEPTKTHVVYARNLLRIPQYAPELKGQILAVITERLVKMDIEIQLNLEEVEEDDDDTFLTDILQRQIDMGQADELSDDDDNASVSSVETEDSETERLKELKDSVMKMDAIIDVLFEFYQPTFTQGTSSDRKDAFDHLQSQFANLILPAHRSRHAQFLLFHFAQTSPELSEQFIATCAQRVVSTALPVAVRLASAAYLASFISRGAHISASAVREAFSLLGAHLEQIRKTYERVCDGPDLFRFGSYYAIAQALLYIFCFRWRDFVQTGGNLPHEETLNSILMERGEKELQWIPSVKELLSRNIYCNLNPLKICSPAIVMQFARIAYHVRFMYVFPLLEKNRRIRLSRSIHAGREMGQNSAAAGDSGKGSNAKSGDAALQLDAYFPFDPYRLPRSKRWLEGDYVEWAGVPGMEDGEDGDDEENDNEDDDDEDGDDDEDEEGEDGEG